MKRDPWHSSDVWGKYVAMLLIVVGVGAYATADEYLSGIVWPKPPVVDPGKGGAPPSDAIVLFDGKDLSKWVNGDKWEIKDGVATSKATSISTKDSFGDCQLHVEWASPKEVKGNGQQRGNSGVYLMGRYEIQILDSFDNDTYYDGQAGGLYKQQPPMVNASRGPGEWQTFDIFFTAPRFDSAGKLEKPGHVTVVHNGVLIQNHTEIQGTTSYFAAPAYAAHPPRQPLQLQFHGNPVQFRNIWLREIKPIVGKKPATNAAPAVGAAKESPRGKVGRPSRASRTTPATTRMLSSQFPERRK